MNKLVGYEKIQLHNCVSIRIYSWKAQISKSSTRGHKYLGTFTLFTLRFTLSDQYDTYEKRSEVFATVLKDMRDRDCLHALRGWRDEVSFHMQEILVFYLLLFSCTWFEPHTINQHYVLSNDLAQVSIDLSSRDILIDPTMAGVFGMRAYGAHVNGYTIDDNGTWRMWIGKRSPTKQTFPGMYDNMVRHIADRSSFLPHWKHFHLRLQVVFLMI